MDKQNKMVIVVRRGLVESVYGDMAPNTVTVEVLDMDTTVPDEIRSSEMREKQVSETLIKIYG